MQQSNKITLLIDADDTLWQNAKAFDDIKSTIAAAIYEIDNSVSIEKLKDFFDTRELEGQQKRSPGIKNFISCLKESIAVILGKTKNIDNVYDKLSKELDLFNKQLYKPLNNVTESLKQLSAISHVKVVTNGEYGEQYKKLELSGLTPFFENSFHVLSSKNKDVYSDFIIDEGLDVDHTFMVGNSPKKDINQALLAGLKTIFIPNRHTWIRDEEDIQIQNGQTAFWAKNFAEIYPLITTGVPQRSILHYDCMTKQIRFYDSNKKKEFTTNIFD